MLSALLAVALIQPAQHSFRIEVFPGPRLMTVPQVQSELGISRSEAYQFITDNASLFNVIQLGRNPLETPAKVRRSVDKLVFQLPKNQQKRLKEMYFQIYGASCILDPKAFSLLKAKPEQQVKVQAIYNQALSKWLVERGKAWAKVPKPTTNHYSFDETKSKANPMSPEVKKYLDRENVRLARLWDESLCECRENALDILTSDQRVKLRRLMGKPMQEQVSNPYRASLFFASQIYRIKNP